jgi:hypothetical protein
MMIDECKKQSPYFKLAPEISFGADFPIINQQS